MDPTASKSPIIHTHETPKTPIHLEEGKLDAIAKESLSALETVGSRDFPQFSATSSTKNISSEVQKHYQQIFSQYQQNKRDRHVESEPLDEELLMKMVTTGLKALEESQHPENHGIKSYVEDNTGKRVKFLAVKKESELQLYQCNKKLGSGNFGKVYLYENRDLFAIKFSLTPHYEADESKADIINSQVIRSKFDHPSIQPAPYEIIPISGKHSQLVSIEHLQNGGDLKSAMKVGGLIKNLPIKERLKLLKITTEALPLTEMHNVAHSDIKTANLLVNRDIVDGNITIKVGDWGGAKDLQILDEIKAKAVKGNEFNELQKHFSAFPKILGIHAAAHTPIALIEAGEKAFKEGDIDGIKKVLHQIDVYQMGIVYLELVVGKSKDELTTYFKPVGRFKPHIESIKLDSLLDMAPDLPPEMKELISSMLFCNPNRSQPTKTEVSAEFNRIVDGMP